MPLPAAGRSDRGDGGKAATIQQVKKAFRLIIKRAVRRNPDLFNQNHYAYQIVASNWPVEEKSADKVLEWHNQRGQS